MTYHDQLINARRESKHEELQEKYSNMTTDEIWDEYVEACDMDEWTEMRKYLINYLIENEGV